MKTIRPFVLPLVALLCVANSGTVHADVFNLPSGQTSLQMVPVGNAGNSNDPNTGNLYGGVSYDYAIGKYDVTVGQYAAFLNAVAATDTYGLYNSNMTSDLNTAGIVQNGSSGSYSYTVIGSPNHPIAHVSWGDAARFANWLSNGQPAGAEGTGTTETGSYTLNGATTNGLLAAVTRNTTATWVIPSESEWYKAAYYNPTTNSYYQFPTSSNTAPMSAPPGSATNAANIYDVSQGFPVYAVTGSTYDSNQNYLTDVGAYTVSSSPYGAFDMGGNVFQWDEATISGPFRGERGGSWSIASQALASSYRTGVTPTYIGSDIGLRVALVPEPSSLLLAALGLAGIVFCCRLRSASRSHLTLLVVCIATLYSAHAQAADLYVSCFDNNAIQKFDPSGNYLGAFTTTGLNGPTGLAFDGAGNLYVANYFSNTIRKFDPTGADLGVFATTGLDTPVGMTFDNSGNLFAANETGNIHKFGPGGEDLGTFATVPTSPGSYLLEDIAFDNSGNLYATSGNIHKFGPTGNNLGSFGSVIEAFGLAFDSSGNLYASGHNGVYRYGPTGPNLGVFDNGLFADEYDAGPFNYPLAEGSVAFDGDGNVYVSQIGANSIIKIGSEGGNNGMHWASTGSEPAFIAFAPVPEPSSLLLALVGFVGLALRTGKKLGSVLPVQIPFQYNATAMLFLSNSFTRQDLRYKTTASATQPKYVGRRLKIQYPHGCGGSSPLSGTFLQAKTYDG